MAARSKIPLWKRAPFLRLLAPLILGIVIQNHYPVPGFSIIVAVIASVLACACYRLMPPYLYFRYQWFQGFFLTALLISLGMASYYMNKAPNHPDWYGNHPPEKYLRLTLTKPVQVRVKTVKAEAAVNYMGDSLLQPVAGKVILYFKTDSRAVKLQYGDIVDIKNKLLPIKNSGNPGAFDYARYMAEHNMYHTAYLQRGDYQPTGLKKRSLLMTMIYSAQGYVLRQIDAYISGERETALAKALLIGYRLGLEKELIQAYSNAGVVHLIAISGLHLGIIYGMLLFLTGKIPLLKNRKVLQTAIVLITIWLFALVTGAAPSVLRAACMFSFISIGKLSKVNTTVYNSLAASAFMLLVFNPLVLWHVGFQLSYMAVLGIVTIQRPLYNLWVIHNKVGDFFWQLASVSVAAQLFTVPLCLYYFHQLPMLFLFANLLLIPLATVVLWASVFLIFVSPIPPVAAILGTGIGYGIRLMNGAVLNINQVSFVTWDGLYVSEAEVLLLFILFGSFCYWLYHKKKIAFAATMAAAFLLVTLFYADDRQKYSAKKLIVYNYPKATAIEVFAARAHYFISDPLVTADKQSFDYNILPARVLFKPRKLTTLDAASRESRMLELKKSRIVHLNSPVYMPTVVTENVLYVIISKDAVSDITPVWEAFRFKTVIFDPSNSKKRINEWKKQCEELNLHYYSVPDEGAFIADI